MTAGDKVQLGLLFVVVLLALLVWLAARRRLRALPDVDADAFLTLYESAYGEGDLSVLEDRHLVADYLGIPERKLSPEQTFAFLKRTSDGLSVEIGLSDLEAEVNRVLSRSGFHGAYQLGETVGQVISDLRKARGGSLS